MLEIGVEAARKRLPELLDLAHAGKTTVIQKRGVPYAALIPLDQRIELSRGGGVLNLKGTGANFWGDNISETIKTNRDEWGD